MSKVQITSVPLRVAMAGVVALTLSICATAFAQSWPTKPLRIVVAWTPGGSVDVTVRPVANRLTQWLNQPVVIEYRAGAAGNIGAQAVARSGADGYTVLATVDMIVSTPPSAKARLRCHARPGAGDPDLAPAAGAGGASFAWGQYCR